MKRQTVLSVILTVTAVFASQSSLAESQTKGAVQNAYKKTLDEICKDISAPTEATKQKTGKLSCSDKMQLLVGPSKSHCSGSTKPQEFAALCDDLKEATVLINTDGKGQGSALAAQGDLSTSADSWTNIKSQACTLGDETEEKSSFAGAVDLQKNSFIFARDGQFTPKSDTNSHFWGAGSFEGSYSADPTDSAKAASLVINKMVYSAFRFNSAGEAKVQEICTLLFEAPVVQTKPTPKPDDTASPAPTPTPTPTPTPAKKGGGCSLAGSRLAGAQAGMLLLLAFAALAWRKRA